MANARDAELQGKWQQARGRVPEAWGALSDGDVERTEGRWDQLVGSIREKTGQTTDTVEAKLNEILDSLSGGDTQR